MRPKQLKNGVKPRRFKTDARCPFCGRHVDLYDADTDFIIRENKYLQKSRQYFHKTCFQRFYSVRGDEGDRTTTSTESD